MTVADIPEHLALVTDEAEQRYFLDTVGLNDEETFGYLWVGTQDGEVTEIWGSSTPGLDRIAFKLY